MGEIYADVDILIRKNMAEAVEIIKKNPGCTKVYVARELFPGEPTSYGDKVVTRCLLWDVVINVSDDGRPMELYAPPLSQEQMEAIATKHGWAVEDLPRWWAGAPRTQYTVIYPPYDQPER